MWRRPISVRVAMSMRRAAVGAAVGGLPGMAQRREYKTNFSPSALKYNLHDFVPTVVTPEIMSKQHPKRHVLTTTFRRFRDVDQCESVMEDGKAQLTQIGSADIGSDVEFACLYLNAALLWDVTPPTSILDHLLTEIVSRITTPLQLETLLSAVSQLYRAKWKAQELEEFLTAVMPTLDAIVPTMGKSTVVLTACIYSDAELATPLLMQALLERAVMLKDAFSPHDAAQFLLAYALSSFRTATDVPELFVEFSPMLKYKAAQISAKDAAALLYAFAVVRHGDAELIDLLGRRLHHVAHAVDADSVAMSFAAMVTMGIDSPLLVKALSDALRMLDPTQLSPLAALDVAWALTQLPHSSPHGATSLARDDDLLDTVMSRVMSDKSVVLNSSEARGRLLQVSAALRERPKLAGNIRR